MYHELQDVSRIPNGIRNSRMHHEFQVVSLIPNGIRNSKMYHEFQDVSLIPRCIVNSKTYYEFHDVSWIPIRNTEFTESSGRSGKRHNCIMKMTFEITQYIGAGEFISLLLFRPNSRVCVCANNASGKIADSGKQIRENHRVCRNKGIRHTHVTRLG